MTIRNWILVGLFGALGLTYVVFFTDWLQPAPIEIASQVRFALQPSRFGRPAKQTNQSSNAGMRLAKPGAGSSAQPAQALKPLQGAKTAQVAIRDQFERIGAPDNGMLDQAPGGVANVTFCLDKWYTLTRIRVEDVPADGTAPTVLWHATGKSVPVNSLLYGVEPTGMKPLLEGTHAEHLKAGVPYRLIVESGRRRGTNDFRTTELRPVD